MTDKKEFVKKAKVLTGVLVELPSGHSVQGHYVQECHYDLARGWANTLYTELQKAEAKLEQVEKAYKELQEDL